MRRQRSLAAFRLAVFEKYREYARQPGTRLFMTIRLQALYRARKARRLANKRRRKRAERALRVLEFRQLPLHVREALGTVRLQSFERGRQVRRRVARLREHKAAEASQWDSLRTGEHLLIASLISH